MASPSSDQESLPEYCDNRNVSPGPEELASGTEDKATPPSKSDQERTPKKKALLRYVALTHVSGEPALLRANNPDPPMVSNQDELIDRVTEEAFRRRTSQNNQSLDEMLTLSSAVDKPITDLKLINEYQRFLNGTNPSRKHKENSKQRFVGNLQKQGFAPTSQKIYLQDVMGFLKYLSVTRPWGVKLAKRRINVLKVEITALLRDIRRNVVQHKLRVKRRKSENLVDSVKHACFIQNCPVLINITLYKLERNPYSPSLLLSFFGLLGGYLVATTGHRKGVLVNMTVKEVQEAERSANGRRVIRVTRPKTQQYFGKAAIPLEAGEYAWLHRYNALRSQVEGGSKATTFFHNSNGNPMMKLPEHFKYEWERCNLGPAPTFDMLRLSVATCSRRQLEQKCFGKVAAFMCYDPNMAKKFYQADDPVEETFKTRALTMIAVSTYAIKKMNKRMARVRNNRGGDDVEPSEDETETSTQKTKEQEGRNGASASSFQDDHTSPGKRKACVQSDGDGPSSSDDGQPSPSKRKTCVQRDGDGSLSSEGDHLPKKTRAGRQSDEEEEMDSSPSEDEESISSSSEDEDSLELVVPKRRALRKRASLPSYPKTLVPWSSSDSGSEDWHPPRKERKHYNSVLETDSSSEDTKHDKKVLEGNFSQSFEEAIATPKKTNCSTVRFFEEAYEDMPLSLTDTEDELMKERPSLPASLAKTVSSDNADDPNIIRNLGITPSKTDKAAVQVFAGIEQAFERPNTTNTLAKHPEDYRENMCLKRWIIHQPVTEQKVSQEKINSQKQNKKRNDSEEEEENEEEVLEEGEEEVLEEGEENEEEVLEEEEENEEEEEEVLEGEEENEEEILEEEEENEEEEEEVLEEEEEIEEEIPEEEEENEEEILVEEEEEILVEEEEEILEEEEEKEEEEEEIPEEEVEKEEEVPEDQEEKEEEVPEEEEENEEEEEEIPEEEVEKEGEIPEEEEENEEEEEEIPEEEVEKEEEVPEEEEENEEEEEEIPEEEVEKEGEIPEEEEENEEEEEEIPEEEVEKEEEIPEEEEEKEEEVPEDQEEKEEEIPEEEEEEEEEIPEEEEEEIPEEEVEKEEGKKNGQKERSAKAEMIEGMHSKRQKKQERPDGGENEKDIFEEEEMKEEGMKNGQMSSKKARMN